MSVAVVTPTVPLGSSMDVPELVIGTEELDLNTSTGVETLLGETHTIVSEFVKTTIEVVSEVAVLTQEVSSSPTSKKDYKWREVESVASPPIDIVEDKDSYHVYAEIAGMNLKDITIDLSNNLFTLEGFKQEHHTPNKRKRGASADVLVRQEISKGRFKRVLELPDDADTEDVNVSFEEGMLQFKIRKVEVDREDSADEESDSDQVTTDDKATHNNNKCEQAQVVEAVVVEKVEEEEKSENGKEAGDVEEVNLSNGEIRVALKKNNKVDNKKHQRPDTTKKLNKKRSSCLVQ